MALRMSSCTLASAQERRSHTMVAHVPDGLQLTRQDLISLDVSLIEHAGCSAAVGSRTALSAERKLRHRGDSSPCGQSPMDCESIPLAARAQCHVQRCSCCMITALQ